jgi:hypothetical protein
MTYVKLLRGSITLHLDNVVHDAPCSVVRQLAARPLAVSQNSINHQYRHRTVQDSRLCRLLPSSVGRIIPMLPSHTLQKGIASICTMTSQNETPSSESFLLLASLPSLYLLAVCYLHSWE